MEPTDDKSEALRQLGEHIEEIERTIDRAVKLVADLPRSRESALVSTKLDEARLWLGRVPEEVR